MSNMFRWICMVVVLATVWSASTAATTAECNCPSSESENRVCGADGVEYINSCGAVCQGTEVACEQSCPCPASLGPELGDEEDNNEDYDNDNVDNEEESAEDDDNDDYEEESDEDYNEQSDEEYDEDIDEDYDEESDEDYDEESDEDYDEDSDEDYDEEGEEDYDDE